MTEPYKSHAELYFHQHHFDLKLVLEGSVCRYDAEDPCSGITLVSYIVYHRPVIYNRSAIPFVLSRGSQSCLRNAFGFTHLGQDDLYFLRFRTSIRAGVRALPLRVDTGCEDDIGCGSNSEHPQKCSCSLCGNELRQGQRMLGSAHAHVRGRLQERGDVREM